MDLTRWQADLEIEVPHSQIEFARGGVTERLDECDVGGVLYYNSGTAAGYSWAAATDINGMSPNNGLIVGYTDNKGNNGYNGWTTWGCSGSNTTYANATLNPYYTNGFSYANKKTVWVHELGHALGLNHSGSNAIMYYCSTCTGFTTPQTDDANGINSLY